ncbi:hypothetical protein HYW76_05605 [Candidatus Pacearchaeota archaeon]|nr:hypothetical protein [Candidatus Pacearchaeota archaeon]
MEQVRDAITLEIRRIFEHGKANFILPASLKCHPYYEDIHQRVIEGIKDNLETPRVKEMQDILIKAGVLRDREEFNNLQTLFNLGTNEFNYLVFHLTELIISDTLTYVDRIPRFLAGLLLMRDSRPYFPRAMERYSYNSNKNTLMLSDFIAFEQCPKIYRELGEIILVNEEERRIVWNPRHLSKHRIGRLVKNLFPLKQNLTGRFQPLPERVYLGSSWTGHRRDGEVDVRENGLEDAITRDDAIDFLRLGCSPKEIAECFPEFTKMQLAAFKAHLTMGTYQHDETK